jgi:uncharacterized membrane protein SpoIIM required for sporulation/ABC-type transport system involved in multi-copper enzyme maturation permease subunit
MAAISIKQSTGGWWSGMWLLVRRELRDTFRDWRMITPIVLLTLIFPVIMTLTAGAAQNFVNRYGTPLIGERLIPFLLLIVGFFPMSFSLVIALESFVGERERKSLEPLLSTPLTDGQLYVGKTIASLIPALCAAYLGISVYALGLILFRHWTPPLLLLLQILLLTSVEGLVMVAGAVVVSTRATSVRASNLLASFIIIPMALLVQGESIIMFWAAYDVLWYIGLGLVVVALILVRMGIGLFNREELLGREIDSISLHGIARRLKHYWLVAEPERVEQGLWLKRLYLQHIPAALRRTRVAIVMAIICLCGVAALGLVISRALALPADAIDLSHLSTTNFAPGTPNLLLSDFSWQAVWWNNIRSLLLALVLGVFSFGSLAVVLLMIPIGLVTFVAGLVGGIGYNPIVFLVAFILPHGLLELPAAIIATAGALRIGTAILHRSPEMSMGDRWWLALVDFVKLFVFVVIPMLLVAALLEVYLTPRVVCAVYGCSG